MRGRLTGPTGRVAEVELLVDTGATLLVVPRELADQLELAPVRSQRVVTGGGQREVWPVAEVRLSLDGQEVTTPCFIGPAGPPLLGAVALESLFLAVDPVGKRLVPVEGFVGMLASAHVARRSFTVDEFHRMAAAGIFAEDDRVELLDGEIVEMTPIGSRHAACVKRLVDILIPLQTARRAILSIQDPIRLGEHSEPQPDLALLNPRADFYAAAHPGPDDVLLVVEVAETSAAPDREIKVPLYARHGVPETWLVDLDAGQVEVFRQPSPEGYREMQTLQRGDTFAPQAFPDRRLAAADILG